MSISGTNSLSLLKNTCSVSQVGVEVEPTSGWHTFTSDQSIEDHWSGATSATSAVSLCDSSCGCSSVLSTDVSAVTPHSGRNTHLCMVTSGSSGKLWYTLSHSHAHARIHTPRSSSRQKENNTHGTGWVQWIHAAGKICTQMEQDKRNNLERRGRGGGCAAPCSTEIWPTTSTPSQTLGKRHFNYSRNHTLILKCDDWSTSLLFSFAQFK